MANLSEETVRVFEEIDIEYVIPFLDRYKEIFKHTGATEQGTVFDIWAKNDTGRKKDFSTIFIEPDKFARLIYAYDCYGAWSFYAVQVQETDELLVFFVPIVKRFQTDDWLCENVRINGPDGQKVEDRFAIPKELAYKFKDGKIIERPQWAEGRYRLKNPKVADVEEMAKELKKVKWALLNQD